MKKPECACGEAGSRGGLGQSEVIMNVDQRRGVYILAAAMVAH
jgi:hypothetical protein